MISPGADQLGAVVDVLFATAGIESEIVAAAEVLEVLPGLLMPVATAGHLVALKLLARDDETRPQNASDLQVRSAAHDLASKVTTPSRSTLAACATCTTLACNHLRGEGLWWLTTRPRLARVLG
ncbi:MAG: hypothetical protein ACRDTH_10200 [Pseudonocardiaceae bacterium]